MLEIAPHHLGKPRDQELIAKWQLQRIDVEKGIVEAFKNPETPTLIVEDLTFKATLLDNMLSRAVNRATTWGFQDEVRGSLKLTSSLIHTLAEDAIDQRGL